MIQSLFYIFPTTLFGAQFILTLVLVKGEICPGQRGRIYRLLPVIGLLWLAVVFIKLEAIIVVLSLFYFYSQAQTNKTRNSPPFWSLFLANGFALIFVGLQLWEQSSGSSSLTLFMFIFLLGGCLGHLLLVIARSRLQAFHRILPVIGIFSAIGFTLSIIPKVNELSNQLSVQPVQMAWTFILIFIAMLCGVVVWCGHLLWQKEVGRVQLIGALSLLMMASLSFYTQIMI